MANLRDRVLRVAHRGNSWGYRENTVAAFESAAAIGCDWLEIDVRTTRDARAVVIHDLTPSRLWRQPASVADLDLHELSALGVAGQRIPTLEQVLEVAATTDTAALIDVTTVADGLTALAAARQYAAGTDLRVAYCGDTEAMLAIRQADPDAEIQYGHPGGPLDDALLAELRPYAVNAEWTLFDVPLVRALHERHLEAWAWTVNDADSMSRLIAMGIDAITTDRVRLLATMVAGHRRALPAEDVAVPAAAHVDRDRSAEVARELAEWAIRYTRDAPLGAVTTKAHAADVVTEVDTAVERYVREVIAAELPGHLLVGEELGGQSQAGVPTWYLDPVDGTTNLASHIPWTSFSLALAVDRSPLVAVVAHPWLDEVVLARRGCGTTRRGEPVRADADHLGVFLTELATHRPWPGMLDLLDRAAASHVTLRIMGSGTATLAGVALGWGQAAAVSAFSPIDHLAALLLVHEAGGVIRDERGRATVFPDPGVGVMVAAPAVADQAYALWRG